MKTYLTKNGMLVVRQDASFFTSNSGEFRRLATNDEVTYLLREVGLPDISLNNASFRAGTELNEKLAYMEIPLWHHLWTTSVDGYTHYNWGTCSNGGDYSYRTSKHFFARNTNGRWEIRVLETHSTSAEFAYDELNGSFQSNLNYMTAIGIAPYDLEDEHGKYEKENEFYFRTQTASGNNEEIALDQILEEGTWTPENAVLEPNYHIPERDSDEEEETIHPTEEEIAQRWAILEKLGIEKESRRATGRNQRRSSKSN